MLGQTKNPFASVGPALRSSSEVWKSSEHHAGEHGARVFVTVSREPGAGALPFANKLAERLNESGSGDWTTWDRELVEKIAAEHHIDREVLEAIETRHHNWLDEFVRGFAASNDDTEFAEARAYKRVMVTLRALARAGHVILVGRGGTFITQGMPGAINIRLVASLEHRIRLTAEREKMSLHDAAAYVAEIDRRRAEFYRRYWPGKSVAPGTFTMTLNVGEMSADEMVDCVVPLVRSRQAQESRLVHHHAALAATK